MFVRGYQMSDCKEITELFYNTVHTINAKDYTKEQLDVWATGQADLEKWKGIIKVKIEKNNRCPNCMTSVVSIYNREKEKNDIVLKKIQFFIKIA